MTDRTRLSSWVWMVAAATFFAIGLGGVASATPVPELDPGTGASGLALLVGGFLLALERYRSR